MAFDLTSGFTHISPLGIGRMFSLTPTKMNPKLLFILTLSILVIKALSSDRYTQNQSPRAGPEYVSLFGFPFLFFYLLV